MGADWVDGLEGLYVAVEINMVIIKRIALCYESLGLMHPISLFTLVIALLHAKLL